jgi:hypothetical protein
MIFNLILTRRIHEFEARYKAEQASHNGMKISPDKDAMKGNTASGKGGGSSSFAHSITEMAGKASWYFPSGANLKQMSNTSNKAASKLFGLFGHQKHTPPPPPPPPPPPSSDK